MADRDRRQDAVQPTPVVGPTHPAEAPAPRSSPGRSGSFGGLLRASSLAHRAEQITALQRTAGNRSVTRMLAIARATESAVAPRPASARVQHIAERLAEGAGDVDDLAAALDDAEMSSLAFDLRMSLVAEVGGGYVVGDEDEGTIVRLLATAPAADAAPILERLKQDRGKLFRRLEGAIDGEEYGKYQDALKKLFLSSMSLVEAAHRTESATELPWADPGFVKSTYRDRFVYERADITDEGKIALVWFSKGPIGPITYVRNERLLDPLEMVRVRFYADDEELGGKEQQVVYMAAVNFLTLVHKQARRNIGRSVDLALLVSGVGTLGAGTRAARVVAALDLAMGAAAVVIDDYRSDIAKSENGRAFLEVWDTVQFLYAVYGGVRVLAALPELFRKLRTAAGRWRATGANSIDAAARAKLEREVEELLRRADEAEREAAAANSAPDPSAASAPKPGETAAAPKAGVTPAAPKPSETPPAAKGPTTGAQDEAKMAEADARLRAPPTPDVFSLGEMVKKRTSFSTIAKRLKEARAGVIAAGLPDPFPSGLQEAILKQDTIGFIRANPELMAEWMRLEVAIEGLTSPIVRNSAEYRALPAAYKRLGPGAVGDLRGEFKQFFGGLVGNRRPDIADFWLDGRRPLVVSDATKNVNRLFHNFKTRFYAVVLETLTGMPVEAWEHSLNSAKQIR